MKALLLAIGCFLSASMYAQETGTPFDGHHWKAPYHFPTPANWGIERFLLPPFFAPPITYKGVEDIRFAPGWAKAQNGEYWSYAFLWYLDAKPALSATILEKDLKAYYTGLLKVNSDSTQQATEKPFEVITKFSKAQPAAGEFAAYTGTVRMRDYMTRKPITLHCMVRGRTCTATGKTFLFFELSPQPLTHAIWKSLHQLWKDFNCSP